ncbi:hypothetical protein [uncultured Succiniclasticum sp.]|uniref:portal protein n=1 Tax=uncultured Succiniclasticum sp. TaxID=1500547 RepID=UPI0025EAF774|nr:hypothetical protein [uncultured Succiniclasticum sp.]
MSIAEGNGLDFTAKLNDSQASVAQGQGIGNTPMIHPNMKPIDFLTMSASPDEKTEEISLDTLKKAEIEKIMKAFDTGKDVANNYFDGTIRPRLEERREMYLAKKEHYEHKFPRLSETSEFCSRDIKSTIKWMLPSLVEPFLGTDDPVDIRAVKIDDDEKAKKVQQLLKYQLQRKNAYPAFIESEWKDALKYNWCVAKVWWKREVERKRYKQMISSRDTEYVILLEQEEAAGNVEIVDVKPLKEAPDIAILTFDKVTVTANHPVVQYMSPDELRYTPDGRNVQDAKFIAHRKIVNGDYLKQKEDEGVYKNVDKAMRDYQNGNGDTHPDELQVLSNRELDTIGTRLSDDDLASQQFELYECYLHVDYNNDGRFESIIVHAIGETPIRISKNDMDMAPFFTFSVESDPINAFNENEGFTDDLEQMQDLKTAIFRQIITNVAKNNSPQTFLNNNVDIDALINNDEYVLCDTTDNPATQVSVGGQLPISPLSMEVVQYAQNEIEAQSGSTRYNQGLDSNSLNKTATGLTAILGQAEKRMKQMSRMYAEDFIVPIFKYIILLNQKYMDQEQLIRLTNENIVITKDELNIDYHLIINVGLGPGTKEAMIQYLMVMINQIYPILAQAGLITPNSWYNIVTELLEKMGIRNVANYILDPNSKEAEAFKAEQEEKAKQAAMMQMQAEMQKAQMEIEKARQPHTSISISYDELPPKAQLDLLQILGAKVNTEDIIQKEELESVKEANKKPSVPPTPQGTGGNRDNGRPAG